jgi:zinc transporter ZupT
VNLVIYKVAAALLIFIASLATVIYPLKKKTKLTHMESFQIGEALASGIFLGAAFFHMLPDSIKMFTHLYGTLTFPIPEVICVLGFLFLLLLERVSLVSTNFQSHHPVPYILFIILTIHAVIEGAALGIGTTLSESIMLFIAIVAHKGSESFGLCVAMLRHQLPFKRIVIILIFFALMTPLGIGLGTVVNLLTFERNGELAAAVFNAFAAGTFLYISTLHHIHFHKHAKDAQGLVEFGSLVLGSVIMGVIALWS